MIRSPALLAARKQCKPQGGKVNLQLIDWIEIAVLTTFGLTVAYFARAFRRKSIAGPKRFLGERTSVIDLLIPAFTGFCASLFAPALYFLLAVGSGHAKATSHQTVCALTLEAAAGFLVIQALDLAQRRNQLRLRYLPDGVVPGAVGALAVIPLVLAATAILQEIMRRAGVASPEEHPLLVVFQQKSVLDRLLVVVSAVIFAPLFEELVFRAHLQSALRRATGHPWAAVIITSALFALVHGIWWMMPPLFLLAVGLGYVYERTRNVWATITMHASFNLLSLTVDFVAMRHH
jgi:membrane protease YdiL (CAAX protease family)